jgi:hypothetical protein
MLNALVISSQEAACYLLNLHMSVCSRKVEYVPTTWSRENQRVRKIKKQMDDEEQGTESTDIWKENVPEKYEFPTPMMETVSLAKFMANFYQDSITKNYKRHRYRKYCGIEITSSWKWISTKKNGSSPRTLSQ